MAELFTSVLLCLVGAIIYICYWTLSIPRKLPPGPRIFPIIGNVYGLFGTKDILKSFVALRGQYGDLFTLTIGGKFYIVVNGYETMKDIFINYADIVSTRSGNFLSNEMIKGNGRFSKFDDVHDLFFLIQTKKPCFYSFSFNLCRHCIFIWPSMENKQNVYNVHVKGIWIRQKIV